MAATYTALPANYTIETVLVAADASSRHTTTPHLPHHIQHTLPVATMLRLTIVWRTGQRGCLYRMAV